MNTYKENVYPCRMWRLKTHMLAFESCYLVTAFEDPGFVLMLPLVFSFQALAISSFPLLFLLFSPPFSSPFLLCLLCLLSPSLPFLPCLPSPFPSHPFFSPLFSSLHSTWPLPSPHLPLPFFPSFSFSRWRQALLLLSLQIGTQVGTSGEDII